MSEQPSAWTTPTPTRTGAVVEVMDGADHGEIDLRSASRAMPGAPMEGRLAVVTGGSGRLGRAIALALAAAGARVCVIGRDLERLRGTTAAAGHHAPILYLQCDLGSTREIEGLGEFIERFDRPVDVLVHVAAVSVDGSFEAGDSADLDELYLVNVRGVLLVTQTFLPQLRDGSGQVVVLVPSVDAGTTTLARVAASGASALAEGLQRDEGAAGVRVSSIEIGSVAHPAPAEAVAQAVMHALELTAGDGAVCGVDLRLRSA